MHTWEQPPLLIMHSFSPERKKKEKREGQERDGCTNTSKSESAHKVHMSGRQEEVWAPAGIKSRPRDDVQTSTQDQSIKELNSQLTQKHKTTCSLLLNNQSFRRLESSCWNIQTRSLLSARPGVMKLYTYLLNLYIYIYLYRYSRFCLCYVYLHIYISINISISSIYVAISIAIYIYKYLYLSIQI